MTGRLNCIKQIAAAYAADMRSSIDEEQQARGILLALVAAIHDGRLESLLAAVQPWMQAELPGEEVGEPLALGVHDGR